MIFKDRFLFIALFLVLVSALPAAIGAKTVTPSDGRKLFNTIFNPESYFGFDYIGARSDGSIGTEELILTVKASARDDYLPEYALAIAYTCEPLPEKGGNFLCGYTARMLRVQADKDGSRFDNALKLAAAVKDARGKKAKLRAFSGAELEWLEADLSDDCEPAVDVMDKLATKADWKPSLHYTRVRMEDRGDLILHPAQMWITMSGNEQISSWQGWRNSNGAAYGVRLLMAELDKCWKPAKNKQPWRK